MSGTNPYFVDFIVPGSCVLDRTGVLELAAGAYHVVPDKASYVVRMVHASGGHTAAHVLHGAHQAAKKAKDVAQVVVINKGCGGTHSTTDGSILHHAVQAGVLEHVANAAGAVAGAVASAAAHGAAAIASAAAP